MPESPIRRVGQNDLTKGTCAPLAAGLGLATVRALLAIERHAGVKPVELHKIRRQDPALGRDVEERKHIRLYGTRSNLRLRAS